MVLESRADYPSEYEAIGSIAGKLGIASPESLRQWVRRAEVDGGARPGKTTEETAEGKRLKKENAELRRANEIAVGRRVVKDALSEPPMACRAYSSSGAHSARYPGRSE